MATAINDFIQGIVMLAGIVAVIAAVLNGQGGFLHALGSLAELESDVAVTMGQKGAFTSFFGPDPLNLNNKNTGQHRHSNHANLVRNVKSHAKQPGKPIVYRCCIWN